jgi:hypothetical protein
VGQALRDAASIMLTTQFQLSLDLSVMDAEVKEVHKFIKGLYLDISRNFVKSKFSTSRDRFLNISTFVGCSIYVEVRQYLSVK